jgi:hypothetical protein
MQKYVSTTNGSKYARMKLLGYYAQRIITSRRIRVAARHATIAALRLAHRKRGLTKWPRPSSVEAMRQKGYQKLGRFLSSAQCHEILDYLRDKPVVAQRGSRVKFTIDSVPTNTVTGDYSLETVVGCPYVLEMANHPEVLALAASYLGYTPTITLMGLRWSFPTDTPDVDVQMFHRDLEIGSIKLMIFLTDVDAKSGPHHYVQGTHLDRAPMRLRRYSDQEVMRQHGGSVIVTGPAGTAFAIDTKGIHKGAPPIRHPRLLLTVQYSLLPCLNYDYEPIAFSGGERFDPYVNRLMIAPYPAKDLTPMPCTEEMATSAD